jgi:hypothetical protein
MVKAAFRFRLSVPPPTVTDSDAIAKKLNRKKINETIRNRGERN